MQSIAWFLFAFLCGSLPFSFWIGRLFLHADVRQFGDANPGATNVLRAGGRATAVLALLLDFVKGAVPVWLAYRWAGVDSVALTLVALAPVLGHAFSPFLGFQGGKAVGNLIDTSRYDLKQVFAAVCCRVKILLIPA